MPDRVLNLTPCAWLRSRPMSELDEWAAFVTEAIEIHEPAVDKLRRLAQVQRDLIRANELTAEETDGLLARVYEALPRDSRARC